MTAHLLVSDRAPHVRSLLRHRSLLLAKATFVAVSAAPPRALRPLRRAPSALVLDARDAIHEWRTFATVSLSTPVLVLSDDEHPTPDASAEPTVFYATPSSLAHVVPSFLAAIDPTILLIDALLSTQGGCMKNPIVSVACVQKSIRRTLPVKSRLSWKL